MSESRSPHSGAVLVAAVVVAAACFAFFASPSAPPRVSRGSAAPDFELPQLSGPGISLEALRGRVVLLNFWATWCKPCEDEMPAMERLYRALPRDEFELLAISVDTSDTDVAGFRDRLRLSFPILLDPDKRVAAIYHTFAFPESLLVDREGVVVERYIGPKEWDAPDYVARIQRLVER